MRFVAASLRIDADWIWEQKMPDAGPILLYDKSTLQSLTVDESVWLDTFYFPCMTPLFFIETLADLEKEVQKGRTPEDVVGNLAKKTPLGGAINVHHHTLSINELLGKRFELRNVPVVAGGNPVTTRDGRRGVVFDPPPEAVAMQRWEDRQFLEVEHQFAKSWREALSGIDLEELFRQGRNIIKRIGRPKDLEAAKAAAIELLGKRGSRYVTENLRTLKPAGLSEAVLDRWNRFGNPPIFSYAPYTAHVLSVDLFFCIGLGADLIGRERPTNKIDIAYLYYLPFCMAFTSRDKLHGRTAPLFLGAGQEFIHGDDLKADLAKLNAHYSALPDEVKQRGVMSFAHYPPVEGDFLISKLWDKLMRPEWREWARKPMEPKSPEPEEEAKVLAEVNKIADAPRDAVALPDDHAEPDAMLVQRRVPLRRGSWRMLPPEVEKARSK